MNREDHYYPSRVFKDSCAYQRSQVEDYSHSPPPCLYMSRQVHSVYTTPSVGALEQASLPDIAPSYGLPMREDLPQLYHPQGLQQEPLPPAADYGEPGEQGRYHLPFPWMKSTKSHSHTWKGQWSGKSANPPHTDRLTCHLFDSIITKRITELRDDSVWFGDNIYNHLSAYFKLWVFGLQHCSVGI